MAVHKIQQSGNSFYLYMPNQWVADNKLRKGSEVSVNLQSSNVMIAPLRSNDKYKSTSLSIKPDNPEVVADVITHLFVAGYDEFELKFNSELVKESYDKLKELIKHLGLNMIDLNKGGVKFYVNLSVNDIRKFSRDFLYKALNLTRMIIHDEGKELFKELVTSFYYYMFITLRTITRFQQGLTQLDIKPYESRFYTRLAVDLSRLVIHLQEIKDLGFIKEVKDVLQKLLNVFDKPSLDDLIELKKVILNAYPKRTVNEEGYHKTRVGRFLKDIVYVMTVNHLITLEKKGHDV